MTNRILDPGHIDYLVLAAIKASEPEYTSAPVFFRHERVTEENADALGVALLDAHVDYVRRCYPGEEIAAPAAYQFDRYGLPPVTGAQTLKAVNAYECQSGGSPFFWYEDLLARDVFMFCQNLRSAAARDVPGYGEADWCIKR